MNIMLVLAFLFFIGSTSGWVIELLFRRFFTAKRWINPGFLIGPYLPLYGFGTIGLYFVCQIDLTFISNLFLRTLVVVIMMSLIMTLIEYIAGLIFIKYMKIKLWDYSDRFLNIQGIICPLFTILWGLVGAFYYFFINPSIVESVNWLSSHIAFSFFVGMFFGIFFVDVCCSFNLSKRLRKAADEYGIIIKYENLKSSIRTHLEEAKTRVSFLLAFKTDVSLRDAILDYKNRENSKSKRKEEIDEKGLK